MASSVRALLCLIDCFVPSPWDLSRNDGRIDHRMHGRTMHRDWHHHQISTDMVKALISGALLVPNTRSYLVFPMLLVPMESTERQSDDNGRLQKMSR